jgi:hypothetical protein
VRSKISDSDRGLGLEAGDVQVAMCNNLLHDWASVDSQCPLRNDRSERHQDKDGLTRHDSAQGWNEEFWCQIAPTWPIYQTHPAYNGLSLGFCRFHDIEPTLSITTTYKTPAAP